MVQNPYDATKLKRPSASPRSRLRLYLVLAAIWAASFTGAVWSGYTYRDDIAEKLDIDQMAVRILTWVENGCF